MNKTVFQNINLSCVFQNSNPNFLTANGSTNVNSNQPVVPSAREALNKFKMEAAQEVDVPSSY